MLQKLGDHIQACLDRADECDRAAKVASAFAAIDQPFASEPKVSSRHFLAMRTRRALTVIIIISVIGMLGLIALVSFSNFPGSTQGTSDKSEAPPEDVRRSQ
jgi:hypothetical protein